MQPKQHEPICDSRSPLLPRSLLGSREEDGTPAGPKVICTDQFSCAPKPFTSNMMASEQSLYIGSQGSWPCGRRNTPASMMVANVSIRSAVTLIRLVERAHTPRHILYVCVCSVFMSEVDARHHDTTQYDTARLIDKDRCHSIFWGHSRQQCSRTAARPGLQVVTTAIPWSCSSCRIQSEGDWSSASRGRPPARLVISLASLRRE